jgi:nitroreductase
MSEIADSKLDAKTKDENVKDANVKKASGESPLLGVLKQRRSVPALRLTDPGPNADELEQLLTVATRVPDHGALEPWRIVVAQGSARQELADKLTTAFLRGATAQQDLAAADVTARKIRAVFTVAPLIVIVVSRADPSARIPEWEQILSAGAVCMNLISAAATLGYSSTWLTGWSAYDPAASKILGIGTNERVAGIIPIGTAVDRPDDRPRPSLEKRVTRWTSA